ncbi:hypothetical protein [Streptomyces sp. A5-4]|uniref:hypothetical protein n=1 Tax=Streptomyces sp. A5-4 TaxID=3384771 RepID=UPI003DA92E3F
MPAVEKIGSVSQRRYEEIIAEDRHRPSRAQVTIDGSSKPSTAHTNPAEGPAKCTFIGPGELLAASRDHPIEAAVRRPPQQRNDSR